LPPPAPSLACVSAIISGTPRNIKLAKVHTEDDLPVIIIALRYSEAGYHISAMALDAFRHHQCELIFSLLDIYRCRSGSPILSTYSVKLSFGPSTDPWGTAPPSGGAL